MTMSLDLKLSKMVQYLVLGFEVNIDDEIFKIVDNNLCVKRISYDSSTPELKEEVYLKVFNIGFLNELAKNITEEELFLVGSNKVLTEIAKRGLTDE